MKTYAIAWTEFYNDTIRVEFYKAKTPFGAAKDIYIWQPIFELLRTNHVQLIVPTRGATPAITGKFDVNYILGQRMVDHMQQTVVVDYSSNVDIEQMEYVKMDFEQEVFDFL